MHGCHSRCEQGTPQSPVHRSTTENSQQSAGQEVAWHACISGPAKLCKQPPTHSPEWHACAPSEDSARPIWSSHVAHGMAYRELVDTLTWAIFATLPTADLRGTLLCTKTLTSGRLTRNHGPGMRHVDRVFFPKGLRWEKPKSEQCSRLGLGWGRGQSSEGEGSADATNWSGMVATGSAETLLIRAGCFRSWQMTGGREGVGGVVVDNFLHPVLFISSYIIV